MAVLVLVSSVDSSSVRNVTGLHYSDYIYSDDYSDDSPDSDSDDEYETIYDAIRDEIPALLTQVERRYKSHIQDHTDHVPLLSLVAQVFLTAKVSSSTSYQINLSVCLFVWCHSTGCPQKKFTLALLTGKLK